MWLSPYSLAISMISSSRDWIIQLITGLDHSFQGGLLLLQLLSIFPQPLAQGLQLCDLWLDFSSCSPSRLTSLIASSSSRTKGQVSFTWSMKHPMWSRSPAGITIALASSQAWLRKWQYCDCSICSFASCRSNTKASCAASRMPPSNVHLSVVATTT
jgi:hypothetical protein